MSGNGNGMSAMEAAVGVAADTKLELDALVGEIPKDRRVAINQATAEMSRYLGSEGFTLAEAWATVNFLRGSVLANAMATKLGGDPGDLGYLAAVSVAAL